MRNVIIFGSSNMDLSIQTKSVPEKGETVEGYGFITNPGGKGANQAVAAAKCGAKTYFISKMGNDFFGNDVKESLRESGVQLDCLLDDECYTGIAVILRSEGDNRIICDYGANQMISKEEVIQALNQIGKTGDIFLTQFECEQKIVFDALAEARLRGLVTILNPAPAKTIPDHVYQLLDYIIVNQTECKELTGIYPKTEEDCLKAAEYFYSKGVKTPIITLGVDGSFCYLNRQALKVNSYKVENVDTTAAGDTYAGAFASRLATGEDISKSLEFAAKAAALTVTKRGAQQSIPYLQEIESYFN